MQVEILEKRLSNTDVHTGRHYSQEKGDVVEVSDDWGARWCRLGWAKDKSGNVKTGERKPGPEIVIPAKSVSGSRGRTRG